MSAPPAVVPPPPPPAPVPPQPQVTQRPKLSQQPPTPPKPSLSSYRPKMTSTAYGSTQIGQIIVASILLVSAIIMASLAIWFGTTALNQNTVQDTRIAQLNVTDMVLSSEIQTVNMTLITVNSTLQSEIDVILAALNLTNSSCIDTINNVPGIARNINFTSQTPGTLTINSPGAGFINLYVTAVTSVATGTGLTGGPITGSGTISLANTAVTAGSYTLASITVDAQGRITAASSGSAGSGTVTNVATGTGLTGGPITTTGTISLANTAVTPGSYTYGSFTVDQQGRLTAASSGTSPVTSVSTGTGLTGGPITSTGIISLANTAVTPGSYVFASITVDAQGRITAASSGSAGSGTVTNVATGTGLTGGPITTTGTISLANTAVTPGSYTYGAFTVDQQGRLTAASSGTAPVTSVATGTGLTGGPITSTGTISLANTAVTAGSYTLASITVDAQGRITAASSGSAGSGTVTNVATGTGLTGGPITTTGTISLADTAVTPGSYTYGSFTVDQQGRLTAASSGTSPVTSVATGTGLTGGPITSTGTISLANTAVTAGSYTLASITVDAQGRITAASSGSAGSGTVTNVATGTGLTGGPITTTGTIALANTAVTPGSYTGASITVDQQGRLTAASSGTVVAFKNNGIVSTSSSGGAGQGVMVISSSTKYGPLQIEAVYFFFDTNTASPWSFSWPAGTLPVSTAVDTFFIRVLMGGNTTPILVDVTCNLDGSVTVSGTSNTASLTTWYGTFTRNHPA